MAGVMYAINAGLRDWLARPMPSLGFHIINSIYHHREIVLTIQLYIGVLLLTRMKHPIGEGFDAVSH